MRKKTILFASSIVVCLSILAGCAGTASTPKPAASAKADAVSSASQVNDEAAFEQKISKDNAG